ncbi:HNH endonuclease signature motif containing protein [Chromohalobacter salexigens]|uniref:HNH endonuclease n=1 Tax=Chromohalobacter israelensis TaxID=141390 RepID=UPI0032E91B61
MRADRIQPASEVDHIVGQAFGGTDDDDNLEAICTPCHKAKTARESQSGRR